jgi:adenine-specific DNA-methyltransferase
VAKRGRRTAQAAALQGAEAYRHPEAESLLRPDVGTQSQFKKKKPPITYRYDSSLSPALDWDGQSPARELGEWLIGLIEKATALPPPHIFDKPQEFRLGNGQLAAVVRGLQDAVEQLKQISKPFLNWAGKAERLSFDVPTLPLFVHERLSTKGIIETLTGHRKKGSQEQLTMFDLFGDPQRPVIDQVLKAYEYKDKWVNRMILGDSLVVMNSLLHYEGLGGQVQMIYMDPPYGVKFGSNFQPFVRKRDVTHNDDEDMTREPEMVKAYRDTWELGLHSYLTYLRDRLLLARDLLAPGGSIFVQISDENLHHVREVMDEVFGTENFCQVVTFVKTSGQRTKDVHRVCDYLLWYAKSKPEQKYHQMFAEKVSTGEIENDDFASTDLTSMNPGYRYTFTFQGKTFDSGNRFWSISEDKMRLLEQQERLYASKNTLRYKRLPSDFHYRPLSNVWVDTTVSGAEGKLYVVQTTTKVIERCMLMTTDPGDLVLDPTCGGGTTTYVAEQWRRRWIAIDTSRVPLALARQRLLTATFPYYQLKDEARGPAGGFVYVRKQNKKGEEVGGIVPHVTLKSIANNEPPEEEVLVDRPEVDNKITRVTGPFCVEATIPTPVDWEGDGIEDSGALSPEAHGSFVDRMLEVLRKSPVLHVGGGKTVTFKNVRPPAKTLSLSAEAVVVNGNGRSPHPGPLPEGEGGKAVALVFGPENGAVSEKLVYEAAREAYAKSYNHLYVIGFAIQPNARKLVEDCEAAVGIPATYVQATPDLMMGDLLKNMRSSQIFSVCGLPEVKIHKVKPKTAGDPVMYQAELLGLDVFDPVTMEADHRKGEDVPAWLLDMDYNGLCFHVSQAFFPRTSAWDNLKRALKGTYEESVWDHLAGTKSAPFEAGEHGQVAVKVIDDRGNELLVVKSLTEAQT